MRNDQVESCLDAPVLDVPSPIPFQNFIARNPSAADDGGLCALARATAPRGCICLRRPTSSLVGRPIGLLIDQRAA
jgi:hypothetical protein